MQRNVLCADLALSEVPEGRNNVAHCGSGGEIDRHDRRTPSGVTHGTQPEEIIRYQGTRLHLNLSRKIR